MRHPKAADGVAIPESPRKARPIVRRGTKPESAAVAGIAYALLAGTALLLFQTVPIEATGGEWDTWIGDAANRRNLTVAVNLATLSAVAFLWFVAVIRRRLGAREDKFFATVFLGSALVYVGLWLVAAAILASPAVLHSLSGGTLLAWQQYQLSEGVAGGLLLIAGKGIQGVFVASTSMVFLRTRVVPKWLAYLGFALALAIFVMPLLWKLVGLGLPVFVLIASITILLTRHEAAPSGRSAATL
jgi:hypothetical protein